MDNIIWEVYLAAKEWQTLIGAVIATIAAVLTILQMQRQRVETYQRYEDRQDRKKLASRAKMPDALSGISDYAREVGKFLTNPIDSRPIDPITSVNTLQQVIEHVDDDAAKMLFELVSWYQIQRVRLSDYNGSHESVDRMYDVVLLQAHANRLFDYARNEKDSVSTERPSADEMVNARNIVFGRWPPKKKSSELDKRIKWRHK